MSAGTILITLFFLLAPAGVLRLCRQFPTLGKIGPVLILYLLGILVGNLFHPAGMARIQQALSYMLRQRHRRIVMRFQHQLDDL